MGCLACSFLPKSTKWNTYRHCIDAPSPIWYCSHSPDYPRSPPDGQGGFLVRCTINTSVGQLFTIDPKDLVRVSEDYCFLFGISTDPVWVSIRLSFDDDESFKEAAVNLHFNNPQLASDPNDLNIPVMRVPVRSSGSISSTLPRTPRGVKDN